MVAKASMFELKDISCQTQETDYGQLDTVYIGATSTLRGNHNNKQNLSDVLTLLDQRSSPSLRSVCIHF